MDNKTFEVPANCSHFAVYNFIGRGSDCDEIQQELVFHINDICSSGGVVRYVSRGQTTGMRLSWKVKEPQIRKQCVSVIPIASNVKTFVVFFNRNDITLEELSRETWTDDEGNECVEIVYESIPQKLIGDMIGCNVSYYAITDAMLTDGLQLQVGF